jgi:hypothetical protein
MKVKTEFIKVNELHVDIDSQRALRTVWAKHIADNYDANKLGIFHVSPNGTGYRLMDGQHRKEALKMLGKGDQRVRCLVYTDLTKQDEAAIFLGLNNSKQVRAFDKFRVRVTQGDSTAVAITEILSEIGLVLADQKRDGAVRAVNQLENIYTGQALRLKEGPYPDELRWTLSILKDAWGYDANAFDATLIEGLGALMLRFGTRIDRDRFGKKLAVFPGGPKGLQGKAKGWKDVKGVTLKNATAELLTDIYNNQLRSNAIPSWDRA